MQRFRLLIDVIPWVKVPVPLEKTIKTLTGHCSDVKCKDELEISEPPSYVPILNYCGRRVTKTKLRTIIAASGAQSVAFYAFKGTQERNISEIILKC